MSTINKDYQMALIIRVHEQLNESFNPKTTKIGNQVWMAEDLSIDDGGDGIFLIENVYYYTWDAAVRVSKHLQGWRLPSTHDFEKLIDYCGDNSSTRLRSNVGWSKYGVPSSNLYGFSAMANGVYFSSDYVGNYMEEASFWTTNNKIDVADTFEIIYDRKNAFISTKMKKDARTVRLIKD